MGIFAFKRMREREAAAQAAASAPKRKTSTVTPDGSNNRRNSGRRKRQQLHDADGGEHVRGGDDLQHGRKQADDGNG